MKRTFKEGEYSISLEDNDDGSKRIVYKSIQSVYLDTDSKDKELSKSLDYAFNDDNKNSDMLQGIVNTIEEGLDDAVDSFHYSPMVEEMIDDDFDNLKIRVRNSKIEDIQNFEDDDNWMDKV